MEKAEYVATIGMFDGVHSGHQFVLQQVIQTAREHQLQPMAITFDHSLRQEPSLTTLNEKLDLISQMGIVRVEVLPFTVELKQMRAFEFMQQVLRDRLGVKVLLTGYDNRFGRNREEGFDDYVRYGQQLGIEVRQLPAEGQVSSSLIRQQLLEGQVAAAAEALGHPYQLTGSIAHGHHIGTKLGFPTANLVPDDKRKIVPATGVYAVRVMVDKHLYHGMMNIGHRPTFDGSQQTLETHVFHLSEDLYGRQMTICFIDRLREEQRFESADALKRQLLLDARQAEELLTKK